MQTQNQQRTGGIGQFIADLPLYAKISLSVLVVLSVAVALGLWALLNFQRASLTADINRSLQTNANPLAEVVAFTLDIQDEALHILSIDQLLQNGVESANASYTGSAAEIEAQLENLDTQWLSAANSDPLIQRVLNNDMVVELNEYNTQIANNIETMLTDRYGALVAATNLTSDYVQSDEVWWQAAWNSGQGAVYVGQPEYDRSADALGIVFAIPIRAHGSDEVIGVLRSTVNINALVETLEEFAIGETGHAEIILPDGNTLHEAEEGGLTSISAEEFEQIVSIPDEGIAQFVLEGTLRLVVADDLDEELEPLGLPPLGWTLIVSQDVSEALSLVDNTTRLTIVGSIGVFALTAFVIFSITRAVTRPIQSLTNAARQFAGGDLTQRVYLRQHDEVGTLSETFNNMADQLQTTIEDLDARVATRTADLETSAEIAAAANQVRDVNDLLSLAVNLIRDRFNFYYVQVYLVQGDQAILREGTGYVGRRLLNRGHKLPLNGRSLVAEAIRTNQPQIVQDTKSNPYFLPNELLADTRAEITIPLRTKNAVIGVLDIQHSVPNAFDEGAQRLFQSMADQLAVTFENVNLYESTQRRAVQMQTVAEVSAAATSNLNTDELLKQVVDLTKERFSLYHAHVYLLDDAGENLVLASGAGEPGRIMKERGHSIPLSREQSLVARAARNRQGIIVNDVTQEPGFLANPLLSSTQSELAVPMVVGDTLVGVLDVQSEYLNRFDEEDVRVQESLAAQIAVAVQNARAFEQVQAAEQQVRRSIKSLEDLRFAIDESAIVAITDVTGKITYANDRFCEISEYSREELIGQDHRLINSGFHPKEYIRHMWVTIANGDVWHGELRNRAKSGDYYWVDTTIVPLLNEEGKPTQYISIRYEITERKIAEEQIERRARQLNTIAEISTIISASLDINTMLQQVVDLTQERFYRYHAHIYLYDPATEDLVLAAGAGEAGRAMKQRGHSIPFNRERSLVARAARTRQPVIVDDVTEAPDFLPNPLLPDTRSEMALPIMLGGTVLGVLDLQDNRPNAFDGEDAQIKTTLADQIAVAVQNARAFEQVKSAQAAQREADQLLRGVIDNIPVRVFWKDMQSHFLGANRPLAHDIGVEVDDLVGKTDYDFFPQSEADHFVTDDRYIMESGEMRIGYEEPLTAPDKPTSWLRTSKLPLRDVNGNVIGVLGTYEDITGIKQAEEALRLRNRAIESSTSGVTIADATQPDMPLIYVNPTFERITGYSFAEAVGRNCRFLQNDDRDQADLAEVRAALKEGRDCKVLLRNYRKNGEMFWNELSMSPIHDALGNVTHFVGVSNDVTERVEAEQERSVLSAVVTRLVSANTREELLSAFDVYTPLINADTSLLLYVNSDDQGQAEYVHVIAAQNDITGVLNSSFRLADFPFSQLWMGNPSTPLLVGDVLSDPRVDEATRAIYSQLQTRATAVLPLTYKEAWVALVVFNWQQPRQFSLLETRIFTGLMDRAAAAIASVRASEAIQVARSEAERRAGELETVARVSAATTTLLNVEELLLAVVELTKESFNLYHAHIYLLDDEGENLVLAAGAGQPGYMMLQRGHAIPFNREHSLVARAARTRRAVVSNDVTQEPDFLPNPLLPNTRSEMALPMIVGDTVLGVLDVQSDIIDRFTEQDIVVKSTLADQVAVAVNNARTYEVEREAAERLREVDRLKSQFLANMSHELRTPLNSIIGYSEVLLDGVDGDLPEEAVEDVEAIHDSGKHLLALINEILDMAKIDAGQLNLDRKLTDLSKILSDALKTGQALIKDKPVTIALVEDNPVPQVYADALRMRQVLLNLVSNAVKFTEQGSVTISYGMQNDHEIFIKVQDTGMGISPDNLPLIFERFRQVDGSSTRRAGGTGLGLSITQQLVQLHGGEIYAESELGVGSTFWFTLPTSETLPVVQAATTNGANGNH